MVFHVALYIMVMGVILAGTGYALARPANVGVSGRRMTLKGGIGTVLTVMVSVYAAGVLFPLRDPPSGVPYITVLLISVAVVLLTDGTGRYWPAVAAVSAAAAGAWVAAPDWLTYMTGAVFAAFALIALLRPRLTFWEFAAVQVLCAGWDYYEIITMRAAPPLPPPVVAHTPAAFTAAVGADPALLMIPSHLALLSMPATGIGIGDIAMPGLLIVIAGRAGRDAGTPWLYRAGICGYAAGLAAGLSAGYVTRSNMPALVFLVSGIIIAVAAAAWRTGTWPALAARGTSQPRREPSDRAPCPASPGT